MLLVNHSSCSAKRFFAGLICGSILFVGLSTSRSAAASEPVDPALIQALQQATRDISEKTTDLESLVWLSAMSDNLVKRIPNPFYRVRLLSAVYTEAAIAGLDPQLVLAVIDIESNFNRFAISHAGAQGLMQVMPFWKDVYGKPNDDLFNPLVSLRYGCTILRHYMDKYEDPRKALAAYNGSLGRDIYPDKVFARLARDWEYKEDKYTSRNPTSIAVYETVEKLVPVN